MAVLLGYLLGSVPTAQLLARTRGVDLMAEGSGNPGTANALRTSGPLIAAAVLTVEAAKGFAAIHGGHWIADETGAVAAGLGAVAGNVYNLWYRFRGGKGLGISLGVLAGLWPAVLLPVVGVIVVGVIVSRSSGIASLAAIAALIVSSFVRPPIELGTGVIESTELLPVVAIGIGLIIGWKHCQDVPLRSPARH
ncbi:MAG TPA: glycerol-3-phosphate acyltransferase [Acidimicrobiia bacterium]|nr:glycerol-3-phosphate acyltransferase [Acidimicrobiia bacterium]